MEEYTVAQIITLALVVFNFIWALAVVPWLLRISKLEDKVDKLNAQLAIQYIQKTDFENHLLRIETSLSKIQDYMMNRRRTDD